jgi:GDP-4-dehydro-6-deoxy-D-mannose reductase
MSLALVVGAGGFIGRHLCDDLHNTGWAVVGAGRSRQPAAWGDKWISCDIRDHRSAKAAVIETRPDVVFHVAGTDRTDLAALLEVNVLGTANLLATGTRVVVAGSAAEYGHIPNDELPATESAALRPVSFYGIAKAAQTMLALLADGDAIVARLFNITGPDEPPTLVGGAIASQIAAVERTGLPGTIDVGNVEAERDFVDVRDAAHALVAVAERGEAGEAYNVCSGTLTRIRDVLDQLLGRAYVRIEARFDPAREPESDTPRMFGSPAKLVESTGWSASWPLGETLADLLESWRRRLL